LFEINYFSTKTITALMANQVNVGIQNQFHESFGATDSEVKHLNPDASLSNDSAGADTNGNPDIVQPHVEGESVTPAPPETIMSRNTSTLIRYGMGDTVISGRPEYTNNPNNTFSNRTANTEKAAAPLPQNVPIPICPDPADMGSSGLETSSPAIANPQEKPLATPVAKSATDSPKAVNMNAAPPVSRDSAVYETARTFGVAHGYSEVKIDKLAAVLYHEGAAAQQRTLASPALLSERLDLTPVNKDGSFNIAAGQISFGRAIVWRTTAPAPQMRPPPMGASIGPGQGRLPESEVAGSASGRVDIGPMSTPFGGGGGGADDVSGHNGGGGGGSAGDYGGGADIGDYSRHSGDGGSGPWGGGSDNGSGSVNGTGSRGGDGDSGVGSEDYQYRGSGNFDGGGDEGGRGGADAAGDGANASATPNGSGQNSNCLPITGYDANGNRTSREDVTVVTATRIPSSHGDSANDYLNVDSYGIGDTQADDTDAGAGRATESLPPIENLYRPFEGHVASNYRAAVAEMMNPNASWDERIINGTLATLSSPIAVLDMMGESAINAANMAARGSQWFARANVTTNPETRVTSILGGIVEMTNAFNGAVGPFAGVVGVPQRVMTVEELARLRFPGADATRAARATYGTLESTTAVRTLANIEGRFANASREVGFIVDARNGQILGVTRSGLDNTTQVRLNPQTDFPLMSGNIFTHNHPLGGALSAADVAVALGSGAAEFRAITPTRTMSLTFDNPPTNLLGKPEAAVAFMTSEESAIIASYRARVNEGTLMPPSDFAARMVYQSDYLMQQLVERNPWIHYTVTPR
jgi:hypothetical protein